MMHAPPESRTRHGTDATRPPAPKRRGRAAHHFPAAGAAGPSDAHGGGNVVVERRVPARSGTGRCTCLHSRSGLEDEIAAQIRRSGAVAAPIRSLVWRQITPALVRVPATFDAPTGVVMCSVRRAEIDTMALREPLADFRDRHARAVGGHAHVDRERVQTPDP